MTFHNQTRQSKSIPKKLFKTGRWHLIPLYYLLMTSYLAREGIKNGGSHDFADHVYKGEPRGKFGIGRVIDWLVLRLKSAQSMRYRYIYAKEEILKQVKEHDSGKFHILSAPSGYAREIFEAANTLKQESHPNYDKVTWHLLDLNKDILRQIKTERGEQHDLNFWHGDALSERTYEDMKNFDMVISTGFTEFLDDESVVDFYRVIKKNLEEGGCLVTSGMKSHKFSDYLLKHLAELKTSYRGESELRKLADEAGFSKTSTYKDPHGLQTIMVAEK